MPEKNFGIKKLNLTGSSGTPTITSANNINLNAVNVAISSDTSVGSDLIVKGTSTFDGGITVKTDLIVGIGTSVGIGTTNPGRSLHVDGAIRYRQRIPNSTQTALHINTTTGDIAATASSRKFKTNIQDYDKGLETLTQLRSVSFQFLDNELTNAGLIAEEVDDLGLSEFVRYDENGDPYSIPYDNLSALYINAIKELKKENDLLKTEIQNIKNHLGLEN